MSYTETKQSDAKSQRQQSDASDFTERAAFSIRSGSVKQWRSQDFSMAGVQSQRHIVMM